jgi:hypothetical protein
MQVKDILKKYGLTKNTTLQYIDAIIRLNQTETAEEIEVSRDTINRYKRAFREMTRVERAQLISSLIQEKLLENASDTG